MNDLDKKSMRVCRISAAVFFVMMAGLFIGSYMCGTDMMCTVPMFGTFHSFSTFFLAFIVGIMGAVFLGVSEPHRHDWEFNRVTDKLETIYRCNCGAVKKTKR